MISIFTQIKYYVYVAHLLILIIFVTYEANAIEPIATIGNPYPEKHVFLDNDTFVRVVPSYIQIVDTNTGDVVDEFGKFSYGPDIWLSTDGSHLASTIYSVDTKEKILHVWDVNSRKQLMEWKSEDRVDYVAFNPIHPILATSNINDISLWNWKTGEFIGNMIGERRETKYCFEYERQFTNGSSRGSTCKSPPRNHNMVFTPDGLQLIVASMRPDIEAWDVQTRQLVGHFEGHTGNWVDGLAISPDGTKLASYEREAASVHVWDIKSRVLLWKTKSGIGRIANLTFSPDNQLLYVASNTAGMSRFGDGPWEGWDDNVRVWNVESGQQLDLFNTEFNALQSIDISPDGKMALLLYADAEILWDIEKKQIQQMWTDFVGSWPYDDVELSPDGKTVLAVSPHFIKSWDVTTQQMQLLVSAEDYKFEGFTISPDSQKFAVGKAPRVEIRDLQTGKVELQFPHYISAVEKITYSSTGRWLAVVDLWGDLHILNVEHPENSLKVGIIIENQSPNFDQVAFSQDDNYLAASCETRSNGVDKNWILIWKRVENKFISQYVERAHQLYSPPAFATLGDGSTVLAAPGRGEIHISKLLDDRMENITTLTGYASVLFSEDPRYLLVNEGANMQIWDWKRNRRINHAEIPKFISISKDRTVILSDEIIGQYSVWNISKELSLLPYSVEPNGKQFVTLGQIKRNQLFQNFPNPFNPETWIPFKLADESNVTIDIHSSTGKLIRSLSPGTMKAGDYSTQTQAVHWDGKNNDGEPVSSGIYFYTINAGDFSAIRKMLIKK